MTISVPMQAPNGLGGVITGAKSGTIYAIPASGIVLVQQQDLTSFVDLGFQAVGPLSGFGTPGTGVTSAEYGDPHDHTSVLTVNGVLPAIAGGASLGLGLLLYTFPAGAQIVTASQMKLAITQTGGNITADTPKVGLGSVVASGAVAVLNGTATFMDFLTQQTAADCNGTPTVKTATPTSSPFVEITEAAGSKSVYFNAAYAWDAGGDLAAKVTGSVILNWRQMS